MRNLSSNWKEKVKSGMDVQYLKYADITLTDGTVLNLTSADLWANGFSFEDSVSNDSSFDIGSAIINVLNLSINNFDGEYSDYDFEGAEVICYVGMEFNDGTTEKIRICTATVVEQPEDETVTIDLTCEDNMRKFDRNYSDSKLKYPATRGQIVRDACEVCGVTLQTTSFDRDDYIVQIRPDNEALTFRQVLQWVAQIGCQWLRCDEYGRLCVKWYDTEKTDAQEIDTTYSFTPQHTDVVITGIQVTEYSDSSDEEPESYMAGTQGYVMAISDNKLIRKGDGQTVASMIAEKCVGMQFRPFESQCPTNVALEAGDAITIVDRNGKTYNTYLTTTTLSPGSGQNIFCNAKSAAKNSSTRYSQATQAYVEARKMVEKEKTARELAIKKLQESLSVGSGLFATYVQQEDGSTISYFHDKGTLAESKNVIKITAEAIGVSNDGGKTYPFGFQLTGTMITKLLYAEGINADYIDSGALTVRDKNGDIIFQVNMDTNTVYMNPDILIIGNQTLTEKLTDMDNSIAEAKNMTMQLTNDYQSITTDADGNIAGTFPTVTTTAQVMYGTNDVTNDCTYTVTKSNNVTGSWDDSTHTYTVTGLSADNGWVDIKATYLINLSVTKRFTISKQKSGKNGKQLYTWRKYASMPDGSDMSDSPEYVKLLDSAESPILDSTGDEIYTVTEAIYVGIADNKTTETPSDNPKDYIWSRFRGEDGADGIGIPGENGETSYIHTAYANSIDGTVDFSTTDTDRIYIGHYSDFEKTDSADPAKYTWARMRGEDGPPGRTYYLRANTEILLMGQDKKVTPEKLTVNVYYRDGQGEETAYAGWWKAERSTDSGKTWTTITLNQTEATGACTITSSLQIIGSRGMIRVTCYLDQAKTSIADMQTYSVALDVAALTQEQIVKILSDDGKWNGLYYNNGKLYISFSAAMGGTLVLGGKNNGNGIQKIFSSNGTLSSKSSNGGTIYYDSEGKAQSIITGGKIYVLAQSVELSSTDQKCYGVVYTGNGITAFIGKIHEDSYNNVYFHEDVIRVPLEGNQVDPIAIIHTDDDYEVTVCAEYLNVYKEAWFEVAPKFSNFGIGVSSSATPLGLEIDSDGIWTMVRIASSAKRYKDIRSDISEQEIEEWYNITPVWAKYKEGYLSQSDENSDKYLQMFLADDVEKHMPEAAVHRNGKIEDWNYRVMIPAMFAMIKAQKKKIDQQEKLINKLYEHLNLVKEI